jgi:hypothetical protein
MNQLSMGEVLKRDAAFLKEMVIEQVQKERPECFLTITESGVVCAEADRAYVLSVIERTKELIAEAVRLARLLGIDVKYDSRYNPRATFDRIIKKATPLFS